MTINYDINILNLVQHVELNKIGWWNYVIQRLILATLWMDGKSGSMSVVALDESIFSCFELRLGGKLDAAITQLILSGDIIKLSDGSIKLAETSVKQLNLEINDAEAIIDKAKIYFINNLTNEKVKQEDKETIWKDFNDIFLRPFIKNIGANIYDLLNGKSTSIDQSLLDAFLSHYSVEQESCLNDLARIFLNSRDLDVRSYILRSLNAYFCIEASGLDSSTLESLQKSVVQPQDIILFIDTNFLFSILGLDENPSKAAAIGLVDLTKMLNKKLNVQLYVSYQTLQEARSVLIKTIYDLNGTRFTPNMAEAAGSFVSGLAKKFFHEVNRLNTALTPKEYFQPYIDNLVVILRQKGVEIYNEETSNLNTRQDVVDDILDQSQYEQHKWGERAKAYKTLEHDIVLWHFIKDKRKVGIDSPLDAKYWIVTIDYRFLGFDDYMKSKSIINLPICIHPTTLVQLLQFWIPRTQLLEDALYSSLWLPFIFRDFDPQSENITIEIVKTLGRFENIGDLPKDTIVRILVDEVLRQKITNETDIDKQIELVREALIEQNKKAQAQAEDAINKIKEYEHDLNKKDADIVSIRDDLCITREELAQERSSRKHLADEISALKSSIDQKNEENLAKSTIRSTVLLKILVPILILLIVWLIIISLFPGIISIIGVISGIAIFIWVISFDRYGAKNPIIAVWPIFRRFHSSKKWVLSVFGAIILGLVVNALYDSIKPFLAGLFHNP